MLLNNQIISYDRDQILDLLDFSTLKIIQMNRHASVDHALQTPFILSIFLQISYMFVPTSC